MTEELIFTVSGTTPVPARRVELAAAGLRERQDVEEWVINHPAILGADVFVVTSEFSGWATKKGEKDLDRLDVLGLASDGRLVLVELKRGKAPGTIHMQALNYAARANLFTVPQLVQLHRSFLHARGQSVTSDEARTRLVAYAPGLTDATLSEVPRIRPRRNRLRHGCHDHRGLPEAQAPR